MRDVELWGLSIVYSGKNFDRSLVTGERHPHVARSRNLGSSWPTNARRTGATKR